MKKNFKPHIAYITLVAIHLVFGLQISIPVIWPDEHLYLLMAQMISGLADYQPVIFGGLEGSFGYSLLIAPLYYLSQEPIAFFKLVMVFNAFAGSSILFAVYFIAKDAFKASEKESLIAAIIVSLYPAYVLQGTVAYTDAITPALFAWVFYSFYRLISCKSIVNALLFIALTILLATVHSRFLPLILISFFFLLYLFRKREINITLFSISSIFLFMALFIIATVSSYILQDAAASNQLINRITNILFSIIEALTLICVFFGIVFYTSKRQYYFLALIVLSILLAIFIQEYYISLVVLSVIYLLPLILYEKIGVKISESILAIALSLITYSLILLIAYIYPSTEGLFDYIELWAVNAIGTLFYGQYSTLTILIPTICFIVMGIFKHNFYAMKFHLSEELGIKDDKGNNNVYFYLLNYLLWSFVFLFVITKTASYYTAEYYRSDHLFYGRYMEAFMAPVFTLGILNILRLKTRNLIRNQLLGAIIFLIFTVGLTLHYGLSLKSDLSVHSVISFFPLRAALGELNIPIFFIVAVITFIAFVLLRNFKTLGTALIAIYFLGNIAFTFYFVSNYFQYERKLRTVVAEKVTEIEPMEAVFYQNKMKYSFSGNDLTNIYLLPDYQFIFEYYPESIKTSHYCIGRASHGNHFHNAYLLAVESSGEDHFWLIDDSPEPELINSIPGYSNLNLMDSSVAGIKKDKFYKNSWINGKSSIKFNNPKELDEFTIVFSVYNSFPKSNELIIFLNGDEIFKEQIHSGAWNYKLKISLPEHANLFNFDFFSDLDKDEKNLLLGINLIDFSILTSDSTVSMPITSNGKFNSAIKPVRAWFRENINASKINFITNQSITLPIKIKNFSGVELPSDNKMLYFTYCWRNYVTRKIEFQSEKQKIQNIPNHYYFEFFNTFQAPEKPGKYFLEMMLYQNDEPVENELYTPKRIVFIVKEK